jgi:DNA-binding NarL/FixJ family response regulator
MMKAGPYDAVTRVAVVDDDEYSRLYLKTLLDSTDNFQFVGGFANATEALDGIPRLRPDLTLMDVRLPDFSGIECTKRLRQSMPSLKVVMITATHDNYCMEASLQAGAAAYILKSIAVAQVLVTLRFAAVNNRETQASGERPVRKSQRPKKSEPPFYLTPREKEVLMYLANGFLYKEIAAKLGISFAAVHKHQYGIYKKLRANNRSEAIRTWLQSGGGYLNKVRNEIWSNPAAA